MVDWDISQIRDIIPRIAEVISQLKQINVKILYIITHHSPWTTSKTWANRIQHLKGIDFCIPGTWGAEIVDELEPFENDIIIIKHRYSAFVNTNLPLILRSLDIKTLLIAGTATNVCVESTARDAFMLDYEVITLRDCVAGPSNEQHNASLKNLETYFGRVADSRQIINELRARA